MQVIASTEFAALITPLAVGKLLGRAFCEWLAVCDDNSICDCGFDYFAQSA